MLTEREKYINRQNTINKILQIIVEKIMEDNKNATRNKSITHRNSE